MGNVRKKPARKKLAFWNKAEEVGVCVMFVSLAFTIVALIAFLIMNANTDAVYGIAGNVTDAMADAAMWVLKRIHFVIIGFLCALYFALYAMLQFIGINIGPKD